MATANGNALGWALKTLRRRPELQWTQFDLAVKSGISIHRISSIEGGRVAATRKDLSAFAKALGVKSSDILQLAEAGTPLMHRTRAYAPLPHMDNVSAHVSYTFYSGQPYIICSSLMHVEEDIFVQASRNSEIVFNHAVLNEFVWLDPLGAVQNLLIEGAREHPIHGLEIPPDTPWMAFINREKSVGFASILLEYVNTNLFGDPASEVQPYIYVQNGPWIYWSRGLVYPFGGLNFTRMMPVRAGSLYFEKNAWVPFRFSNGDNPFADLEVLRKRLKNPLLKHEWMGTDQRTPEKWVMPILTMPFDEGVEGAVSGHKAPKE